MDQKSYTNVPQDVVFRDKSVSELELADAVRAGAVVVNSPDPAGRVADVAGAHAAETGHQTSTRSALWTIVGHSDHFSVHSGRKQFLPLAGARKQTIWDFR